MRVLTLQINGDAVQVSAPDHWTLLEVLRYEVGLFGSKQGCDKGDCGACTVQLDGEPVLACLTLAIQAQGRNVRTVEDLAGSELHPLQDSFDRWNAAQCGFCTPGMLLSAEALLRDNPKPTRDQVTDALGGNLCRCTGYTKIVDAILDASES